MMPAEAASTAAAIETAASAVSAQSEGAWWHNADNDAEDDRCATMHLHLSMNAWI